MRHRLLSTLLVAAALAGCEGNARLADDGPRFPEPDRPVSELGSNQFSTEDQRDSRGEASTVMELAEIAEGMTVADIGAGNGYYTVRLAERVGDDGRVLAQDIDGAALTRLARRIERYRLENVSIRQGELADPMLPAASFDRIFMVHMYHEIESPYEFLWRMWPALRDGGQVVVVDIDRPTDQHGIDPLLLSCEFEAVGYELVAFKDAPELAGYYAQFKAAATRPAPGEIERCRGDRAALGARAERPASDKSRESVEFMSFKGLEPISYGGKEVWPLVEGGKGVSATNHLSSGAWAAAGGIGTVSAVNADSYDEDGNPIPQVYPQATRVERFEQLVRYGIEGGTEQVKRAHEISGGKGAININVLWEMGGAQQVLEGILENCPGLVTGVTCGAGMPYKLAEIAAKHNVHYLPIVSSARAFRALWKRSYSKVPDLMAAVVYEDPWLAGGHNGLSNAEDPTKPEDPYPRVAALRDTMRKEGVSEDTAIVMAGGVWFLREWNDWIDNPELGKIMFQFGTRPLLTQESPIPNVWKDMLRTVEPGDVLLHKFSPTGFYSSAVKTPFLYDLMHRSERQIPIFKRDEEEGTIPLADHGKAKYFFVHPGDQRKAQAWMHEGFTEALKTPDDTVVFTTPESAEQIRADQQACMGCLSHCQFSSWKDHDNHTTGRLADPRSFCIQKTLQDIAHGGDPDENLAFAGHAAYRFKQDPFYSNNYTPTVQELVERILTGD